MKTELTFGSPIQQLSSLRASETLSASDECWSMSTTPSSATCDTAFRTSNTCEQRAPPPTHVTPPNPCESMLTAYAQGTLSSI